MIILGNSNSNNKMLKGIRVLEYGLHIMDGREVNFDNIEVIYGDLSFDFSSEISMNKLKYVNGNVHIGAHCSIVMDNLINITGNFYVQNGVSLSVNNLTITPEHFYINTDFTGYKIYGLKNIKAFRYFNAPIIMKQVYQKFNKKYFERT